MDKKNFVFQCVHCNKKYKRPTPYLAPRTDLELELGKCWQGVSHLLGVDQYDSGVLLLLFRHPQIGRHFLILGEALCQKGTRYKTLT